MNDDFLTKLQEKPRKAFADQLYQRINRPMKHEAKHPTWVSPQRLAPAFALCLTLLCAVALLTPTGRAAAGDFLRQIGAITFTTPDDSVAPQPTVAPPAQNSGQLNTATEFAFNAPTTLPAGYSATRPISISQQGDGLLAVQQYRAGEQFILFNAFQYGAADQFTQTLSPNERMTEVNVRGVAGIWLTGRLMDSPTDRGSDLLPTSWLMWDEEGVTYTLFGDALTLEQALSIADDLSP